MTAAQPTYALPASIVSKIDLSKLVGELESVDEALTAAGIRTEAGMKVEPPVLSQGLGEFLALNKLRFDDAKTRAVIVKELRELRTKAPVLHMTFAVEADRTSLQQLCAWVRAEIHPYALIVAGLQPGLVAGVYLRTPNHVHDFSLRAQLRGSHGVLVQQLNALRSKAA